MLFKNTKNHKKNANLEKYLSKYLNIVHLKKSVLRNVDVTDARFFVPDFCIHVCEFYLDSQLA